jgi:DNA-binding MarR family transcriptional regulator
VLTLTEEGRALLDDVTAVRAGLLAEMTEDWSREDVATLSRLLERLGS